MPKLIYALNVFADVVVVVIVTARVDFVYTTETFVCGPTGFTVNGIPKPEVSPPVLCGTIYASRL